MTDDNNPTLRALHDLVATCNDAAEGYAKAAKVIREQAITDWLMDRSNDRDRFAREISEHLGQLGGTPRDDLHEGGILHQGWVDLEQALRGKSTRELLRNCLAGDEGTVKHYTHALSIGLPAEINSLIENQRNEIERDLAWLRKEGHVQAHPATV